ncbi:glucokinase [Anoxybacillus tepidamans]|uniref:Glucokinase n=1 Tax=Anoxybacteroides tepidamans TaxID=265948 RepID=A0A7W8ITN9_9BACL|nr:ROK family protein [Anoxybacillus tepidamans]MBB5325726.1 glucokinase [Anoxybacillus tepidamans]
MWTIGIDLGGTNLRVGVLDEAGQLVKEMSCPTNAEKGPDYVIRQMIRLIEEAKKGFDIQAIGIGSPGPLNPFEGVILEPPNLPGWRNIPLAQKIREATKLKVVLDNDANAAALAEATVGAGKKAESVFYITVSTGIGGGYVLNKKLVQGAQGNCAEIGNMIVDPNAEGAPGLNKGALEALASGTAIGKEGSRLLGIKGGAAEVFQLAEEGNETAKQIIDRAVHYLAIGIANIVHTVNPNHHFRRRGA